MDKFGMLIFSFLIFLIAFWAYSFIAIIGTGEDIILEGEVTNVEIIKNADGTGIEYYLLYMNDDPTPYKIIPSKDIDFTVNSEIVIHLGKMNPRLPMYYCYSDGYVINSIVKIPGGENGSSKD